MIADAPPAVMPARAVQQFEPGVLKDTSFCDMLDGRQGVFISRPACLMEGALKHGCMLVESKRSPASGDLLHLVMPKGAEHPSRVIKVAEPPELIMACPGDSWRQYGRPDFYVVKACRRAEDEGRLLHLHLEWDRLDLNGMKILAVRTGCGNAGSNLRKLSDRFDFSRSSPVSPPIPFFGFIVNFEILPVKGESGKYPTSDAEAQKGMEAEGK